ncbi:MAG: S-layer homology domain-containing protein [Clostridiales bacterium]|nr:S-layer homology domain-containing protein [Clostridiales bacterium]
MRARFILFISIISVVLFSLSSVFVFGSTSAEREILSYEEKITEEGTLKDSYKSGKLLNGELFKEAVENAAAMKKSLSEDVKIKELRTDVLLDLSNTGSSFTLNIDGSLKDYEDEVDSFVVNANGIYLFINPAELDTSGGDSLEISINDNSGVVGRYNGTGMAALVKKGAGVLFAAAGLYLILFSLLFIARNKFNEKFHKKIVTAAGCVFGVVFAVFGLFVFTADIELETESTPVDLSSEETPLFTVSYNNSKTGGIYLGLPLFADGLTEAYSASFIKGTDSGDTAIGGNYSDKFQVLKFPIKSEGDYYVINNKVSFSDVSQSDSVLYEAVSVLGAKNIISGKAEGIYGVNDTVTRAEAVTLLCKLLHLDSSSASVSGGFSDISRDEWFYGYVMAGKENNILLGYDDGTFRAENTITKQEFASILGKVMEERLKYYTLNNYSSLDVYSDIGDIAAWARPEAAVLENAGIRIDSDVYEPLKAITRGEATELLYGVYCLIQ